MEFSGEDDQANSAGAYSTGSGRQQQQQECRIKHLCLMIRRESQIGGVKHMCRVITLKSRSGVGDGPHLLMRWKIQVNPFNLLLRCRCS